VGFIRYCILYVYFPIIDLSSVGFLFNWPPLVLSHGKCSCLSPQRLCCHSNRISCSHNFLNTVMQGRKLIILPKSGFPLENDPLTSAVTLFDVLDFRIEAVMLQCQLILQARWTADILTSGQLIGDNPLLVKPCSQLGTVQNRFWGGLVFNYRKISYRQD